MALIWLSSLLLSACIVAAQPLAAFQMLSLFRFIIFMDNPEIAYLVDRQHHLPGQITASEVQDIIRETRYDLQVVSRSLPIHETISVCQFDFSTIDPNSFLGTGRGFSAIGLAVRRESIRQIDPQAVQMDHLMAVADGIDMESRHEARFQELDNGHITAPSNLALSPSWAYGLLWPFIVPRSCVIPNMPSHSALRITRDDGGRVFAHWDDAIYTSRSLGVAWINGADHVLYTPLLLTSDSSGTTHAPNEMSGLVLAAVVLSTPTDMGYDGGVLAGPAIVELEFGQKHG